MVRVEEQLGNRAAESAQMAANEEIPELFTSGRLAELLHVAPHRVRFVLDTRAHIKPIARAAHMLLYGDLALSQVRHEINAIDARRGSARSERRQRYLFDEDSNECQ